MKKKISLSFGASALVYLSLASGLAQAQTATESSSSNKPAEENQFDDIVVTARQSGESLMDVPLSISAFPSEKINSMNLKSLGDVAQFTPSFTFIAQGNSSGRNDRAFTSMTFRGLYLNSNFSLFAGSFLFVDGAPVLGASPPSMADVAQVEVLKGPQSVYFGRSTFVGAVSYRTRDPSDSFRGSVTAEYSSYDSSQQTISLEGPVIPDLLGVRVGASNWRRGGMYRNDATGGRLGEQRTKSLTGSMLLTPAPNLKIRGYVNVQENRDGSPAQAALKQANYNCSFPGARSGYYCGKLPDADQLAASSIASYDVLDSFIKDRLINNSGNLPLSFDPSYNERFGLKQTLFQASLRADYSTDSGYDFSLLGATHKDKKQIISDLVFSNAQDVPNTFTGPNSREFASWISLLQDKLSDWSVEGRVSTPTDKPLRFVAGASYVSLSAPGSYSLEINPRNLGLSVGVTRRKLTALAGFGAAYYDFTPELTLSLEGRYQIDEITQQLLIGANGLPPSAINGQKLQAKYKTVSPRFSLDYRYAPNSTIYALFSRGYRPGGFNATILGATPDTLAQLEAAGVGIAYGQERLDNYEVGIKSTLFGGKVRTRVALYYDMWRDGQVATPIPIRMPDGQISTTTAPVGNTGKADLNGIEFDTDISFSRNFTTSVGFSYNGVKLKDFYCANCLLIVGDADGSGNRVPASSKYKATFQAEYTDALTDKLDWFIRTDYSFSSKYFTDFSNVAWVGDSHIANLRVGVRNEGMKLEAFVTNLFDDATLTNAQFAADQYTLLSGPRNEIRIGLPVKRQFGLRASYDF